MPDELEELAAWDKDVPVDLLPAVKHRRDSFHDADWNCQWITQHLCYAMLHPDEPETPEFREYASQLKFLKGAIGQSSTQLFHDLVKRNTPSAILKAFFHVYEEGMAVQVRAAFHELLGIGSANAERLGNSPIEWASRHVRNMIVSASYLTDLWLKRCCDPQSYDPNATTDENIYWTNWRAPRLALMQPALGVPYGPSRVWEREDEETSLSMLKAFKNYFVIHLEAVLKNCVGAAHVELAKKTKPEQRSSTDSESQQGVPPNEPDTTPQPSREKNHTPTRALLLRYRSEIKRAILIQLTQNPGASDLEICRALDQDGAVELPKTWKSEPGDRLFVGAYRDSSRRHAIEIAISKIRADLRKRGLLPGR